MPQITLNPNFVYAGLQNMIISQQVFADNINGGYDELVDNARVDGTLFGDQKLYYATDALESEPFLGDEEAGNLLELHRAPAPELQAIVMDVFRQIRLTTDEYLTKQAWMDDNAFSSFTSVLTGWMSATKRIYDSTRYNAFIGTSETSKYKQQQTMEVVEGQNFGLQTARKLANILTEVKDYTGEYNDYGFRRSLSGDELVVVFNAKHYNEIMNVDLPIVFHKEGLLDKFAKYMLPERFFGVPVGTTGTSTTSTDNTESVSPIRSLIEAKYPVDSELDDPRAKLYKDGNWYVHVFPGDVLPNSVEFNQNEAYHEDQTILFKVMHKRSVPYMSSFVVTTSWFNPRSLTTNRYTTFGHNTLARLKNYPFVTVRTAEV